MGRMESPRRTHTASVQLCDERHERLEEYIESTNKSKSDALRDAIDQLTNQEPNTGRVPPADDHLATAYKSLRKLSQGGGRCVRHELAKSHLAQRVPDYTKQTVYGGLLRPLSKRGYLDIRSDAQGNPQAIFVYE
jgi:hypothetical protein